MPLILGEHLFAEGFVGKLHELERNLWIAKVVDKEVEYFNFSDQSQGLYV